MVFEIVKLKIRGPKMIAQPFGMLKHPQITFANLSHTAINPRFKHIPRNKRDPRRLHCLMPQNPRLPVMPDVLDILHLDPSLIQTKLNGSIRKPCMMFFARKALLFDGSHKLTVFNKRRCRIAECG